MIESTWNGAALVEARSNLQRTAKRRGVIRAEEMKRIVEPSLVDVDPDIRQLMREGLQLLLYNSDLSHELGEIVIRHRRRTEHRRFRVGMEYQPIAIVDSSKHRPDRHVLHAAPGIDVRGDGELPHYILMRCVSEMKQGKGKSSLGSALTGCYSTLIDSSEGIAVKKRLAETTIGQVYLKLLMGMVDAQHDHKHPKVREVVQATLNNWQAGEKTLIFCFRTNTAQRLHYIVNERIRREMNKRRDRCMGGPESMKALRSRITGRDRDLVVLGLDRVLWSILWSEQLSSLSERKITPNDLELADDDFPALAEIGLRYGIDLLAERLDRVFLHRATEYVLARRLTQQLKPQGELKRLLHEIGDEGWIQGPYGLSPGTDEEEEGAESIQFDERGVHSIYKRVSEADPADVHRIALELQDRRRRARRQGQVAVLDVYARGPNLWLGPAPREIWTEHNDGVAKTIDEMHKHLTDLRNTDGGFDWESRRLAFQARRLFLPGEVCDPVDGD